MNPLYAAIGLVMLVACAAIIISIFTLAGRTASFMASNQEVDEASDNLSAETITGSNERKGSEMPAERNGDQLTYRLERHARAHPFSQRSPSTITKVAATPSERSTALANLKV